MALERDPEVFVEIYRDVEIWYNRIDDYYKCTYEGRDYRRGTLEILKGTIDFSSVPLL